MLTHKSFTHIVVGAGAAGCVVAARAAENKEFNVLLLEAGKDFDQLNRSTLEQIQDARRVPMQGQSDTFDESIDWNMTVGLPDGSSMSVPQAKLVGGGSSINGGTALRNTSPDADQWVRLGNHAWDFESTIETYSSMEDDLLRGATGRHPITRAKSEAIGKIQRAFLDGSLECGFQMREDLNESRVEGVGYSPVCRRGETRISAANTYIDPIREQSNFTLATNVVVQRVVICGGRATGVILGNGEYVTASQEVVLSAGAIHSPAILQRSGIGEAWLLNSLGIPQVVNLPVGRNLSDHPCIPIMAKPRSGSYTKGDYSLEAQARWSSSSAPEAIDLQLVCFSYLYTQPLSQANSTRGLGGGAVGHVCGIGCNVNKPTSTGRVSIQSKDASVQPVVLPGYLQTTNDRSMAREVVRKAFEILLSEPMQKVLYEPIGLDRATIEDDHLLDKWIQTQYTSTFHFCGSCRMANCDQGGVVDQSGRVYGVPGLRVCDASILPTIPAANTMWTTMMFAERIGVSIRDDQIIGVKTTADLH